MTHGDASDEYLVALLRGELDRGRTREVIEHLRGCDDCRRQLVDVAEVHGSLTAAARLLRVSTTPTTRVALRAAGTGLRGDDSGQRGDGLPPLTRPSSLRGARARRSLIVVAAGAAAVLAIGGVATGFGVLRTGQGSTPVAARAVDLQPVSGSGTGRVTMAGSTTSADGTTRMTISVGLHPAGSGKFYYAWLLDPRTKKMLPLGVVSAGEKTRFDVSAALVSHYHAVDISLEADDGDPVHSATSVLRASY
jgi:hypothetical protein